MPRMVYNPLEEGGGRVEYTTSKNEITPVFLPSFSLYSDLIANKMTKFIQIFGNPTVCPILI